MKRSRAMAMGLVVCLLFVTVAASGAADKKFSLVVREGFGSIKVGDVNSTRSSTSSSFDVIREEHPGNCVGEYLPLPNNFKDWEAELRWRAWRGLSVGFSVSGPTHFSQTSPLTYSFYTDLGKQVDNFIWTSEIHAAAPIKLNLYYSLSLLPRVHLNVNGGIGYYHARIIDKDQWQFMDPTGASVVGYDLFNVTGNQIGFHGGIGFEYKYTQRVSLFAEGLWRLAKIRTLKGTITTHANSYDENGYLTGTYDTSIYQGILYHYSGEDLNVEGIRHEKLLVNDFPPPWIGTDFPADVRKAFLDLSGFTFRIGLKIGLF